MNTAWIVATAILNACAVTAVWGHQRATGRKARGRGDQAIGLTAPAGEGATLDGGSAAAGDGPLPGLPPGNPAAARGEHGGHPSPAAVHGPPPGPGFERIVKDLHVIEHECGCSCFRDGAVIKVTVCRWHKFLRALDQEMEAGT